MPRRRHACRTTTPGTRWAALALIAVLPGCASTAALGLAGRPPESPPRVVQGEAPVGKRPAAISQPAPAPESPSLPPKPAVTMPEVKTILSPHRSARSQGRITAIVLHHTGSAGDAEDVAKWFQTPESKVSAHYIVGRDGTVVRAVPDHLRAWHAGPSRFAGESHVNEFSLGIEICNKGDGIEPYPPEQMAAVTQLVAALSRTYAIPLSRVTRHRDIIQPAGTKMDPSDNFDFAGVVTLVADLLGDSALATR